MTQETPYQIPSNKEVSGGEPIARTYYVETATNVKNARLVTYASNEHSIAVCGDESFSPLGWVTREKTNLKYAESDRTTDYTAGEYVGVVRGPCNVVAYSADTAIKVGNELVSAASGAVKKKATDGSDYCPTVGYALTDYASGFVLVQPTI